MRETGRTNNRALLWWLHALLCLGALAAAIRVQALSPIKAKALPENYGQDGISLSPWLDDTLTVSLWNLLHDYRYEFSDLSFDLNGIEKIAAKDIHCKIMVWRPLSGSETNILNRIHCEPENAPSKNKSRFIVTLGQESVEPSGLPVDPSYTFRGPFADAFVTLLQRESKSSAFLTKYGIRLLSDNKQKAVYLLGDETNVDHPILMCANDAISAKCEVKWPKLKTWTSKVSLGEFGLLLAQTTCSKRNPLGIHGQCPNDWNQTSQFECYYQGQWVDHETWGALDPGANIRCEYIENSISAHFDIPLGPVTVHPWGSRFGMSPTISITGIGLKSLYNVLKTHAQTKQEVRHYPIGYMQLGDGEWGIQSVSLRRYSYPDDNAESALGCDFNDTSHNVFRQSPQKNFIFEREKYTCTVHMGGGSK